METNKIFLIGFNKTGTTSFQSIFEKHVGSSIHHTDWWGYSNLIERKLVGETHHKTIVDKDTAINHFSKHKCFTDGYEGWYGTDLESQLLPDLKFLDENFPNSKFILNTRSLDKWLLSRLYNFHNVTVYPVTTIDINNDEAIMGILEDWVNVHEYWYNYVIDYFQDRDDFIILDIDEDWVSKLNVFLNINAVNTPISNKTSFNANKVRFKNIIDKFLKDE